MYLNVALLALFAVPICAHLREDRAFPDQRPDPFRPGGLLLGPGGPGALALDVSVGGPRLLAELTPRLVFSPTRRMPTRPDTPTRFLPQAAPRSGFR